MKNILTNIAIYFTFVCLPQAVVNNQYNYQELEMDQIYHLYNQKDGNSEKDSIWRWLGISPKNSRIVISCQEIDTASSKDCNRLYVSLSGDVSFSDAKKYCENINITHITEENKIALALSPISGNYVCTLTAIPESNFVIKQPKICDCGWKMSQKKKIVGGMPSSVNEYTSMAGLVNLKTSTLFCGASIVSERHVLTAAHCVADTLTTEIAVLVGDHDISSTTDTSSAALYAVLEITAHEDYNSTTHFNDIAIIKTKKTIEFGISVGPACLPFKNPSVTFTDQKVLALGWGTLEYSGPRSDTLMETTLEIIDNGSCQLKLNDNLITLNQMCTFTEGKDSCQNDSGGPLFWADARTKRLQLVGIISYGVGCATLNPGINTRITSYLPWIVHHSQDVSYCII